jgi:hypothetical protein
VVLTGEIQKVHQIRHGLNKFRRFISGEPVGFDKLRQAIGIFPDNEDVISPFAAIQVDGSGRDIQVTGLRPVEIKCPEKIRFSTAIVESDVFPPGNKIECLGGQKRARETE